MHPNKGYFKKHSQDTGYYSPQGRLAKANALDFYIDRVLPDIPVYFVASFNAERMTVDKLLVLARMRNGVLK